MPEGTHSAMNAHHQRQRERKNSKSFGSIRANKPFYLFQFISSCLSMRVIKTDWFHSVFFVPLSLSLYPPPPPHHRPLFLFSDPTTATWQGRAVYYRQPVDWKSVFSPPQFTCRFIYYSLAANHTNCQFSHLQCLVEEKEKELSWVWLQEIPLIMSTCESSERKRLFVCDNSYNQLCRSHCAIDRSIDRYTFAGHPVECRSGLPTKSEAGRGRTVFTWRGSLLSC